jgi:signal peptidase I
VTPRNSAASLIVINLPDMGLNCLYNIPTRVSIQGALLEYLANKHMNEGEKKVFSRKNLLSVALITFVAVALIRLFIFEAFFVRGESMAPTIMDGEFVLVNKLAYLWSEPERGDIIVAVPRVYPGRVVKRVIGLPGEWFLIENERVVIKNYRNEKSVNLYEN